jgi:hypothetical protein
VLYVQEFLKNLKKGDHLEDFRHRLENDFELNIKEMYGRLDSSGSGYRRTDNKILPAYGIPLDSLRV